MTRRLRTAMTRVGGRPVLVAAPEPGAGGDLGFDILMSLALARRSSAGVAFLRPPAAPHDTLFDLESPEAPLQPLPAAAVAAARFRMSAADAGRALGEWRERLTRDIRVELHREIGDYISGRGTPRQCRDGLRLLRGRVRDANTAALAAIGARPGYLRRTLLRSPIPVELRPAAAAAAERQARAAGIDPAARLAVVHARETPPQQRDLEKKRDDRLRDARIDSYAAACDALVARGFTVVRLGEPGMTPLSRPGVVDLTMSPAWTPLLEVYSLLRSELAITGESWVAAAAYLTNTPRLLVNATEPFLGYPVRAPGLVLPKRVVDRRTGLPASGLDQLGEEYHRRFRDGRRYQYIDNTPAEILDATHELLDWIDGAWTESPAQRAYHEAITAAAVRLRPISAYLRALGSDDGFLGDGRLARAATT